MLQIPAGEISLERTVALFGLKDDEKIWGLHQQPFEIPNTLGMYILVYVRAYRLTTYILKSKTYAISEELFTTPIVKLLAAWE